jgi:HK97 family phage prohead protease
VSDSDYYRYEPGGEHVYEEIPGWWVPLATRVAADISRDIVQDDLGLKFEVRWFRKLDEDQLLIQDLGRRVERLGEMISSLEGKSTPPVTDRPLYHGKRFVTKNDVAGLANSDDAIVWVRADGEPRKAALTVAHEARHLYQFKSGGIGPALRGIAERDAYGYELKTASLLPAEPHGGYQAMVQHQYSEVKTTSQEGVFLAYASTFDDVDLQGDIVRRGAFKQSLEEEKGRFPLLFMHDVTREIGLVKASEDERGLFTIGSLYFNGKGEGVRDAREAWFRMKRRQEAGKPQQLSIGYRARKAHHNREGKRELLDVQLYEVSLVTFAAQPQATVVGT